MSEVIVIPITPHKITKEICYILKDSGVKSAGLKFPRGNIEYGETSEDAAKRVLLQDIGLSSTTSKFMYLMYSNEAVSLSVYMILTMIKADLPNCMVILTGDQLLKKIRENDIPDMASMAALTAVLLQSKEAAKYMVGDTSQENGTRNAEIQQR